MRTPRGSCWVATAGQGIVGEEGRKREWEGGEGREEEEKVREEGEGKGASKGREEREQEEGGDRQR